jgi:hypothetical protein
MEFRLEVATVRRAWGLSRGERDLPNALWHDPARSADFVTTLVVRGLSALNKTRSYSGFHCYNCSLIRKRAACAGANQISSPENGTHSLQTILLQGSFKAFPLS